MNPDLQYIAAFLDCDGTIVITRMKKRRREHRDSFCGIVQFYSQNKQVLMDIQSVLGGNMPPVNRTSLVWTLRLRTQECVTALKALLPYLRIKSDQAILVLRLYEQIGQSPRPRRCGPGKGGAAPMPESVWAERLVMCEEIKFLNQRDPKQFRIDRSNWVNSAKTPVKGQRRAKPQAAEGSAEGVTASSLSANNNENQERPALSIVPRREDIA